MSRRNWQCLDIVKPDIIWRSKAFCNFQAELGFQISQSARLKITQSDSCDHFFRRRILKSKLTTPFWSRSATIEMFRVTLYSTWMICWLETETLVL